MKVLAAARSFAKSAEAKAVLSQAGFEIVLNPHDRPLKEAELLELIQDVDGMVAGMDEVTAAVIDKGAPRLKIVAKHGVGYNNIDLTAAKEHGVQVTITPGANTVSVAELAFALMLAVARKINLMDKSVRAGSWNRVTGGELSGKTLGIVGLGNIGGEVAKRAAAFDMQVVAYDLFPRADWIEKYGVVYKPLSEVIAAADFLSLHAPATPETQGMINRAVLKTMKPSAIIINTARGDLIVEEDLYAALTTGVIAGAGLDTFAQEPPVDSPLFTLDNVVLTPHAGAATAEAVTRMGVTAAEEVVRVLTGKQPLYSVLKK
ncbi:phosphoglycerate dehydrogenase [Acetonema longum]|uniref:Phosphoglycerate dehydrogenase n=1 Tax=Acetonema longum DSM 6540 TaxID=1009370 RepID=F7NMN4_9FIRM|nr:phosphoglycerate dehydrogenase [Acetonema longum]EGO62698.1 phosphoglycerate dehydrogenase [Acetonema longum DSM 6540]